MDEDRIYAAIATELETGNVDKGLWTRLFAECSGNEQQIKVSYIKQRAERLISAERNAAKIKATEKATAIFKTDEQAAFERIATEKAAAEQYFSEKTAAGLRKKDDAERLEAKRIADEKAFAQLRKKTDLIIEKQKSHLQEEAENSKKLSPASTDQFGPGKDWFYDELKRIERRSFARIEDIYTSKSDDVLK